MKAVSLILTSIAMVLLNSCSKDPTIRLKESDYLIFGHFYGECSGEGCIEIFKLEQNQLSEDKRDHYPNPTDFYDGDYVKLSQQQFDRTRDLTDYFPADLLNERDRVIGQPDAGDWGGLYIEYNYNGVRKFWLLDQAKRNIPTKYHGFIDKVNEKIKQLK